MTDRTKRETVGPGPRRPLRTTGAAASGVLVDAFVVRLSLVPDVMSFLGDRAWWLPCWLDRALPGRDVEGSRLQWR